MIGVHTSLNQFPSSGRLARSLIVKSFDPPIYVIKFKGRGGLMTRKKQTQRHRTCVYFVYGKLKRPQLTVHSVGFNRDVTDSVHVNVDEATV